MKFLKGLVSGLGADDARFVYNIDSNPGGIDKVKITEQNAKEHLQEETRERLQFKKHSDEALLAATEANHQVDKKLGACWNALKSLDANSTEADYKKISQEFLVANRAHLPVREARVMYRSEMFGTLMDKLDVSRGELSISDEQISALLLNSSAAVYSYASNKQTVNESLKTAQHMMKYDLDKSGVNVKEWTKNGEITEYQSKMENSQWGEARVDGNGNMTVQGQTFKVEGCEILTGSSMAEYPPRYLSAFVFESIVVEGNRVMARVKNGCHGNLATFRLDGSPVMPVADPVQAGVETDVTTQVEEEVLVVEEPPVVVEDTEEELEEVLEEVCPECDYNAAEIINGIDKSDPKYNQVLLDVMGETFKTVEAARVAFLALYGRREKDRNGMKGVEKNGVYVVLEKYFNPKVSGGLYGMFREIIKADNLVETFVDEGYSEEEAVRLLEAFTGQAEALANVEKNADAFIQTAENRDAGATKDFFMRLGAGAILGTAIAGALGFPPGWAVPALLGGAPLVGINTGIAKNTEITGVNEVFAVMTKEGATAEEMRKIFDSMSNAAESSYIDVQKDALIAVDWHNDLILDNLGDPAVLIAGPNPDLVNGDLTADEVANYQREQVSIDAQKESVNKVLVELQKNGYYFAAGAKGEAKQAARAKEFKLEGMFGKRAEVETDKRDDKKMTEKRALRYHLKEAGRAGTYKEKQKNYEGAMKLMIDEYNTTAQREFDVEWGEDEKLSMENINAVLKEGREYNLGSLPKARHSKYENSLHMRFVPDGKEAKGATPSGKWEVYVKQNDVILPNTSMEYTSVRDAYEGGADLIASGDFLEIAGYDREEDKVLYNSAKRQVVRRLNYFELMMGQVAQLNETKDMMNLVVLNEEREDETGKIGKMFDLETWNGGSHPESVSEKRYRLAVAATLNKFQNYTHFKKEVGVLGMFTGEEMTKIKSVYEGKAGALNLLLQDEGFKTNMKATVRTLQAIGVYNSLRGMNECARFVRDNMNFSGRSAMIESTRKMVTFGEIYGLYMVGKGLFTSEFIEGLKQIKNENSQLTIEQQVDAILIRYPELTREEVMKQFTEKVVSKNPAKVWRLTLGIIGIIGGGANHLVDFIANREARKG